MLDRKDFILQDFVGKIQDFVLQPQQKVRGCLGEWALPGELMYRRWEFKRFHLKAARKDGGPQSRGGRGRGRLGVGATP